jgi:hypothetical protein
MRSRSGSTQFNRPLNKQTRETAKNARKVSTHQHYLTNRQIRLKWKDPTRRNYMWKQNRHETSAKRLKRKKGMCEPTECVELCRKRTNERVWESNIPKKSLFASSLLCAHNFKLEVEERWGVGETVVTMLRGALTSFSPGGTAAPPASRTSYPESDSNALSLMMAQGRAETPLLFSLVY